MSLERDFEKFNGGPTLATQNRMHVTMSALGVIYLNQNTYRILGKPAAVSLYYSREQDTIAIEPANPRLPQSFPVKPCQNAYRILAGPFLGHFKIRTAETIRFVRPDIDDQGVLMLDLRATVNVTRRQRSQTKT